MDNGSGSNEKIRFDTVGCTLIIGIFSVFALLAMTTSYLSLGESLKQAYSEDFKLNKIISWVLACFPPLLLVILNIGGFVKILSLSGIFGIGISAILCIEIYRRLSKKWDILARSLINSKSSFTTSNLSITISFII